jgi:hypothetical protein
MLLDEKEVKSYIGTNLREFARAQEYPEFFINIVKKEIKNY